MAKAPPLSVKMGEERLARVDAYAASANLTRHGAVLDLIDQGLHAASGELPAGPVSKAPGPSIPKPPAERAETANESAQRIHRERAAQEARTAGWFSPKGKGK